jgi:DNA-binding transcriptional LysR family regulator
VVGECESLDDDLRAFEALSEFGLVGEALVVEQGRGKDFLFTPSGEEVVALAVRTLRSWTDSLHRGRRRVGSTVTFGTTESTVEFLGAVGAFMRRWRGERSD